MQREYNSIIKNKIYIFVNLSTSALRSCASRAAVRSVSFLAFFSAASRAFFSRAIACCSFLSAIVRFYWSSISSSAAARSRARATFAGLKNKA
jgi:hypothetical protein